MAVCHFAFRIKRPKSNSGNAENLPEDKIKEMNALADCESRYSKHVPSTRQIAHLAAILAHGNPIAIERPLLAADQAIKLWDACASVRGLKISEGGKLLRETEKMLSNPAEMEMRKIISTSQAPEKYPVPFEDCLRFLMPNKRRPEDRMKIYRDYLRDSMRVSAYMEKGNWSGKAFEDTPIPTDEEIAKIIARNKSEGFSENWYATTRTFFLPWFLDYEAKKLSFRAKKAAAAKWKKSP